MSTVPGAPRPASARSRRCCALALMEMCRPERERILQGWGLHQGIWEGSLHRRGWGGWGRSLHQGGAGEGPCTRAWLGRVAAPGRGWGGSLHQGDDGEGPCTRGIWGGSLLSPWWRGDSDVCALCVMGGFGLQGSASTSEGFRGCGADSSTVLCPRRGDQGMNLSPCTWPRPTVLL